MRSRARIVGILIASFALSSCSDYAVCSAKLEEKGSDIVMDQYLLKTCKSNVEKIQTDCRLFTETSDDRASDELHHLMCLKQSDYYEKKNDCDQLEASVLMQKRSYETVYRRCSR